MLPDHSFKLYLEAIGKGELSHCFFIADAIYFSQDDKAGIHNTLTLLFSV